MGWYASKIDEVERTVVSVVSSESGKRLQRLVASMHENRLDESSPLRACRLVAGVENIAEPITQLRDVAQATSQACLRASSYEPAPVLILALRQELHPWGGARAGQEPG